MHKFMMVFVSSILACPGRYFEKDTQDLISFDTNVNQYKPKYRAQK